MVVQYSENSLFEGAGDVSLLTEESQPLVSADSSPRGLGGNVRGRSVSWCTIPGILGTAVGTLGLVGGACLKVWNQVWGYNDTKVDTVADLVMGASVAGLVRAALPEKADTIARFKRWIVPVFEIDTQALYYNLPLTQVVRQLYFTPLNMLTGALTFDDLGLLLTMRQKKSGYAAEALLPMVEGDAKSFKRTCINQGAILAAGVAMVVIGTQTGSALVGSNLRDAGIAFCSYAFGSVLAQRAWKLVETLASQWNPETPEPTSLKITNAAVKFFQLGHPLIFAAAIVPDSPIGYGVAAASYGAGSMLARTIFQYQNRPVDERTLIERANKVWTIRKPTIILNAAFLLAATGWTIWGEVAGSPRVRGGVAAMYASFVLGALANCAIDLLWKPSKNALANSIFYNAIVQSPAAAIYLYTQTKFVASDGFLDSSSFVQYLLGLSALISFGVALGQDGWQRTREGRSEPAMTPVLGKSMLTWTTVKYFLGNFY